VPTAGRDAFTTPACDVRSTGSSAGAATATCGAARWSGDRGVARAGGVCAGERSARGAVVSGRGTGFAAGSAAGTAGEGDGVGCADRAAVPVDEVRSCPAPLEPAAAGAPTGCDSDGTDELPAGAGGTSAGGGDPGGGESPGDGPDPELAADDTGATAAACTTGPGSTGGCPVAAGAAAIASGDVATGADSAEADGRNGSTLAGST
jgi:hypothetical protein